MISKLRARGRVLGMTRGITRRDVLHGIALGATAAASAPLFGSVAETAEPARLGAQDASGYYPPLLTGLRGSHAGSFEGAHALVDGHGADAPTDTGEEYDLIVVGGGISGLAAAHFYRAQSAAGNRVLILENHDD